MNAEAILAVAGALGFDTPLLERYGPLLLQGLRTTLELVAISVPIGFLLALVLAYARLEGGPVARGPAASAMGFFRGTPAL